MVSDNKQLMVVFHEVDTLIKLLPRNLMTVYRLSSYEQELQDIKTKFLEF